jgi:hypothetical protein
VYREVCKCQNGPILQQDRDERCDESRPSRNLEKRNLISQKLIDPKRQKIATIFKDREKKRLNNNHVVVFHSPRLSSDYSNVSSIVVYDATCDDAVGSLARGGRFFVLDKFF